MSARTLAATAQPLATRAWATSASYVVIYGVTFAFFAPPATHLAETGYSGFDATTATFALLLMAALTVTFGAFLFSYSIGWRVESNVRKHRLSEVRATLEFAGWGVFLAVATAATYILIVSNGGPVTTSLLGSAALALLIPGAMAALFTRAVVDHVAAAKRELITTTVGALAVVALTNYLIVGSLPSIADVPQLFGL